MPIHEHNHQDFRGMTALWKPTHIFRFLFVSLLLSSSAISTGCSSGPAHIAPLVVEDHSQALVHWAKRGVRDAILINFDTHDDFRWIPDDKIEKLRNIYHRRDWKAMSEADSGGDRGLYDVGNWIYAGARLGIFKEVYWVIPFNDFAQKDPGAVLRWFIQNCGFPPEDVKTFTLRNNQFRGFFHGIPVTICGMEALPSIGEPVLLTVDADFYPTYFENYRTAYPRALRTTLGALFNVGYRIQDMVVSYSINGEYLQPQLRWVGDAVAMILRKPEMIKEDKPPEQLLLLQQLDNAYRAENAVEMLSLAKNALPSQPPSVLVYKAYAHMLRGDLDKAYEAATASCTLDRMYCTALPYLATKLWEKGEYPQAERFFLNGYLLDPLMTNGYFQYACDLRSIGKLRAAIEYYRKDVTVNGSFRGNMLIFDTFLMLGDQEHAVDALKTAISGLEYNSYVKVTNPPMADAVYRAIDFCEEKRLKELSVRLKNSPAVQGMFRDYPRQFKRSKRSTVRDFRMERQ